MRQPKKGVIDRTISYMMAVPRDPEDIMDPDTVLARLDNAQDFEFEVQDIGFDEEEENPVLGVLYQGQTYTIHVFAEEFEMTDMYAVNHRFTQANFRAMKAAEAGVTVAMEFGPDPQESFHLQLKLLQCMVPNMVGIVDFCSERLLSSVWARMTAESAVPPSPMYLYAIQAVEGDNGDVWMHTHGLNRCGLVELEILDSDTEHFSVHSSILNAMANQAICRGELPDEGEPDYIAALPGGGAIVTTWIDWEQAVKWYDPHVVGGMDDRMEDHNEDTGVIYAYPTRDDYEGKRFVALSQLPREWLDNPLFLVTNGETRRMSELARERMDFLRAGLNMPDSKVLVKVGLDVDLDKREKAGTDKEHIWFELERLEDGFLYGALSQEPYYIAEMHEGFKAKIPVHALTDWSIDVGGMIVTPDSAYLLVWE